MYDPSRLLRSVGHERINLDRDPGLRLHESCPLFRIYKQLHYIDNLLDLD